MDGQGCSVAWEGVKLNTEQELLPGWMKEKESLGSIFKDPLSKTVKNQAFRDLAMRYMEVGQCAIYFNIIDFKLYNERFGFEAGDALILAMAKILKKYFPYALITRMYADQYVLLTPSSGHYEGISKVRAAIQKLDLPMALDFKAGICFVREQKSISALCDKAKIACDSIKKEREVFSRYYDEELGQLLTKQRYIVDHIEEAMAEGYIKVYYQPLVRALTKEICGFEALVRWADPHYGFLSPAEFIPVLEEYHLIHRLDLYVLEKICQDYQKTKEEGGSLVPVSLNLSRMDFELCDVFLELEERMTKYQVPREMLTLEITESVLNKSQLLISSQIKRFHEAGYKVWMDDFGSGYSSLNILKDFDFDLLKIDMLLLRKFNEKSKKIVSSIVDMAKKIGIRTLAEGVETEEQLEFLREIGCEKLQGYYIGKPAPYLESIMQCREKGFPFEAAWKRRYNDDLGNVNLMGTSSFHSGKEQDGGEEEGFPLAIVERMGDRVEFLYVNPSFERELSVMEGLNSGVAQEILNNREEEIYRSIRHFLDDLSKGLDTGLDTMGGDTFFAIRGKEISHIPGRNAYLVNLQVFQGNFLKLKQKKMMERVKDLYRGYELVLLTEPGRGAAEILYEKEGAYSFSMEGKILEEFAGQVFSKEESKRFFRFLQKNKRIRESEFAKEDFFLAKNPGGGTMVLMVSLKPSELEQKGNILVSIRKIYKDSIAALIQKTLLEEREKDKEEK